MRTIHTRSPYTQEANTQRKLTHRRPAHTEVQYTQEANHIDGQFAKEAKAQLRPITAEASGYRKPIHTAGQHI
jgi:hypothetical protein